MMSGGWVTASGAGIVVSVLEGRGAEVSAGDAVQAGVRGLLLVWDLPDHAGGAARAEWVSVELGGDTRQSNATASNRSHWCHARRLIRAQPGAGASGF